jgi:nucleobase:cation symporter-1, NCS1 family
VAIAPVVPGFLRAATTPGGQVAAPGLFDQLYTYAWFVTFAIGFVVYYLLMNGQKSVQEDQARHATHS